MQSQMIKLFQFLLHGCWHKWEMIEVVRLVSKKDDIPYGQRIYYQCMKCQKVKKEEIK